ncbi:MAG: methyltransferase domain-containing protein [Actinobacteria bacterium]|nr:methyltransferase domain-containing protein [Actinomycetota bacterium]
MGWRTAGQAWGRRAWDWALLQEQLNANSFDVLHQLTGVGDGVHLLDLACGSGMALQRAEARGAVCSGIDASEGLLAVAAERAPGASLTAGDTAALPYDDATFDVVTSTNGVQYGSEQALAEVARVLRPGGRFAMAFWSDPHDYQPYFDAIAAHSPPTGEPSSALRLSDPGVSEALAVSAGLDVLERGEHDVVGLYRTVEDACLGLEAPGAAFGAIEHSGPEAFRATLHDIAQQHRDPASGRVRMVATMGHLVARKP